MIEQLVTLAATAHSSISEQRETAVAAEWAGLVSGPVLRAASEGVIKGRSNRNRKWGQPK